ncbi:enoyl-CoA hydratase/isomerase family protein [Streptomyces sp. NPDC056716]|uniref:enoyl-CoA hydratase/isomerase family protein n=1 Tax=unclassified Streptomyces TaxID=2593676 RepID=UPI00368F331D
MTSGQEGADGGTSLGISRAGATTWLTLRRPPGNKLDLELTRALHRALTDADADPEVRAIVLTGSDGVFCGGADLPAVLAADVLHEFADALVDLFGVFPDLVTPVIAAVNGDALAGGFGLMCSADIAIAVHDARIGTIEARFGTWPVVAQVAAARRTPFPVLMANVLTGVPLSAERAAHFGIVHETVTPAELDQRAAALARAVTAAGSATAVGRPALHQALNLPYRDALRAGAEAFVTLADPRNSDNG